MSDAGNNSEVARLLRQIDLSKLHLLLRSIVPHNRCARARIDRGAGSYRQDGQHGGNHGKQERQVQCRLISCRYRN
jgi:hypothetical protein